MKKYIEIGARIKELRGGLSQKDFADKMGISSLTLQRYEYGERVPPGPALQKLAQISGKSVDWILTGQESSTADRVSEQSSAYYDHETKLILDMLSGMTKEQKRQALRFIEGQKLISERDKKLKEG